MSRDYLIVPDSHAHPNHGNERADWLGKLILDRKPDVVVNIGDLFDMPSLSSYDKGKGSFHGSSYEKDINSGLDFLDRMWHPIKKAKRKQPYKIFLEGNHEHRLKRVLEYDPQLAGDTYGISYSNYQLSHYHNEVVYYEGATPGIFTIDGISFAHYFVSGLMGRPIGGEHHASSLLAKNYSSCVCGHSHAVDWSVKSGSNGKTIMGLVAGVYQDYAAPWAGTVNNLWWPGVVYLRGVDEGTYSPEFIGISQIRREYE